MPNNYALSTLQNINLLFNMKTNLMKEKIIPLYLSNTIYFYYLSSLPENMVNYSGLLLKAWHLFSINFHSGCTTYEKSFAINEYAVTITKTIYIALFSHIFD